VASDLDRTLLQSWRIPEPIPPGTLVLESWAGGCSGMSSIAATRISLLASTSHLLIATTRTVSKYQRLGWLAFSGRFSVCAGGGVLLDSMSPRADWTDECLSRLRVSGWSQGSLDRALTSMLPQSRAEDVEGAIGMAVRRTPYSPDAARHGEFLRAASSLGLCGSWTGTKAYLQVKSIGKAEAARWALGSECQLVAAAGDSELDRHLLEMANSGFTPQDGELAISPSSRMNTVIGPSPGAVIDKISLRLLNAVALNGTNPR
jgi:hypothetical protein